MELQSELSVRFLQHPFIYTLLDSQKVVIIFPAEMLSS
jgi:hypothetical protein